jgi:hypothetical protein
MQFEAATGAAVTAPGGSARLNAFGAAWGMEFLGPPLAA